MKHPDGFQILIAIDQLINTLFAGMADETLSSRAHRLKIERARVWPSRIINALFFWQDDHCKASFESELNRSHLPGSFKNAK